MALFTAAKGWKRPKYPPTDEWIECGLYLSWNIIQSQKRNEVLRWLQLHELQKYHAKGKKPVTKGHISYDLNDTKYPTI